jgi:2-polyprenyl-3-methyl-5-hydroxy-6-metoxy-1,4-benzoquinol methylase
MRPRHYSYELYADPALAESFDGMRFGGPIGRLLAESQERVIASFLEPLDGQRVLDVGTGTGRAAIALAARGAQVSGVDASAEMLAVARRRAAAAGAQVHFVEGDAHGLAFAARSFDAVVCLRVLMHTPDWRRSLAELCRVSDRRVVFDYPSLVSAAALQSTARHLLNLAGGRLEAYRVFSDASIRRALRDNGFTIARMHRQFVFPIALHKRVGSAAWTVRVEAAFERAGFNWLFGSPVTVLAERAPRP